MPQQAVTNGYWNIENLRAQPNASFNLPVKIVRPFNTYGPRQSARAIIPTIITQVLKGEKQLKLGNLTPTRDLTFVKDTAEGFIEISRSEKLYGEITNIGMNDEISVADLIQLILSLTGKKVEIITEEKRVRPGKSEVERLYCDNKKIKEFTRWKPSYTLKKGLLETIEWLGNNSHFYKPQQYNV